MVRKVKGQIPTKPGFYWARMHKDYTMNPREWIVVGVLYPYGKKSDTPGEPDNELMFYRPGDEVERGFEIVREWGPRLEPPTKAKPKKDKTQRSHSSAELP